eukprot:1157837-Pelagomonas_calceolata.AAC.7
MAVLKPEATAADAAEEAGCTTTPRGEGAPGPRGASLAPPAAPPFAGTVFVSVPLDPPEAGAGAAEPGLLFTGPPLPSCGCCGLGPLWVVTLLGPKGGCRVLRVAALPLEAVGGRRGAGVRDSAEDRMVLWRLGVEACS